MLKGRPCGDVYGTDNRLGQGVRSLFGPIFPTPRSTLANVTPLTVYYRLRRVLRPTLLWALRVVQRVIETNQGYTGPQVSHVCIEVALCEVPMFKGVQPGLGEGPIKVGPMSQPRGYHRSCVIHAGSYLPTMFAFCSQPCSGQLGQTCLLIWRYRVVPGPYKFHMVH